MSKKDSFIEISEQNLRELLELSSNISRTKIALIDAMAQRAAFKGEELKQIGEFREYATKCIQLTENLESYLSTKETKNDTKSNME